MKFVEPQTHLIAKPQIDWDAYRAYLRNIGGEAWADRVQGEGLSDGEALVEGAGRACYRSWKPGLNANVTRVREDSTEYLQNVIKSEHGSVFEHANYTFVFENVSRVFTHEMVRHRAGCAYSQESLRFVRLDELSMWVPEWATDDIELMNRSIALVEQMETHQKWMAEHFGLDDKGVPFSVKKEKTSFMRRFAPEGVATHLEWTANLRCIRHVIEMRTAEGAEEEIRIIANQVAHLMDAEAPAAFADYDVEDGVWTPGTRKA